MSNTTIKTVFSTALETVQKHSHGTVTDGMRIVADSGRIAAEQAAERAKLAAKQAAEWAVANPKQAAVLSTSAAVFAAPMLAAMPVLAAFGFTASGVTGGSIAAAAQGANVVAGGLFATLQSAAAGGYGVATVAGSVQGLAGAAAAAAGYSTYHETLGADGDAK